MNRLVRGLLSALTLGILALPGSAAAQFGAEQKYLGAHLGLSGVGSSVAFGLDGEIAYDEHIGIGAFIDTWSFGQSFSVLGTNTSWNVRYVSVAGTGAYHFVVESNPKLDPFLGAALGYFVVNTSVQGVGGGAFGGGGSRLFLGGFGGVRYALNEKFSGVARVGVGASYLTVGIDLKL